MSYVYILADHYEEGSEHLVATLDRAQLPRLVEVFMRRHWAEDIGNEAKLRALLTTIRERLLELLMQPDEELAKEDSHRLQDGWGGMIIHVARIE